MTIVPLVTSLLITGIAATAERAKASKLATRAFVTFIVLLWVSSALGGALTLGFLDLWPLDPGAAAALKGALAQEAPKIGEVPPFTDFLIAMVPSNPVTSAASDAFLPLILFTTVFAFAVTRLPAEERQRLTGFFEALGNAMLVVINWVLWLGPIGVGALAYVVGARAGTSAFGALLHYVAVISGVGIVLWLLSAPFAWIAGRVSLLRYLRAIGPSQAVALSTQSSLASLPAMLKATEKLDVPVAHSGVTLPIGVAIFRWTGPAMNFAVAIYVAHWFGIPLGPGQIAAGLAAGAITTMGAVGLPGTVSFVSSIAPIAIAMFAQGAALMAGKAHDELARAYPGDRPSSTLLLETLDPRTLGALLAFYEQRTFVNAVLLGINPFDQFGVELGKEMAKAAGAGGGDFDPSTNDLIARAFP